MKNHKPLDKIQKCRGTFGFIIFDGERFSLFPPGSWCFSSKICFACVCSFGQSTKESLDFGSDHTCKYTNGRGRDDSPWMETQQSYNIRIWSTGFIYCPSTELLLLNRIDNKLKPHSVEAICIMQFEHTHFVIDIFSSFIHHFHFSVFNNFPILYSCIGF